MGIKTFFWPTCRQLISRYSSILFNAFSTVVVRWSSRSACNKTRGGEGEGRKGERGVGAREQLSWDSWQGKRAPGTFEKSMALITKCRYLGRLQSLLYTVSLPRPWVVDVTFVLFKNRRLFLKHIFRYFFRNIFFDIIPYISSVHLKFHRNLVKKIFAFFFKLFDHSIDLLFPLKSIVT